MANARDLERKARGFAEQIQELLNCTVCDNAKFGAVVVPAGVTAGTLVTTSNWQSKPVPLRTNARTPIWLDARFWLALDDIEERFLTVQTSVFGILVGPEDDRRDVLHYDFERGKDKGSEKYTEAHLQVYGTHPQFEQYASDVGAKDQLSRYHLPVGGRRLRPCMEDVIEFLALEKLVDPKPGWQTVLDQRRKEYRTKQIQALVRKHHQTAFDELIRIGYKLKIEKPVEPKAIALLKRLLGIEVPIGKDKRGNR